MSEDHDNLLTALHDGAAATSSKAPTPPASSTPSTPWRPAMSSSPPTTCPSWPIWRLVLNPKTVRNHVSMVMTKIHVRDRSAAIVMARRAGLGGEPGEPER